MVVKTATRADTAAQIQLDYANVSHRGGLGLSNMHNVADPSCCEMGSGYVCSVIPPHYYTVNEAQSSISKL